MSEAFGLVLSGDTVGTVVTSGTAGNFGSWTTIGTATANFDGVDFVISDVDTSAEYTVELRLAGATTILESLQFKSQETTIFVCSKFFIPFSGLSGNTIECRTKNSGASRLMTVSGCFLTDLPFVPSNVQSGYGVVSVDPGGTANTIGTLIEITTAAGLDEYADYLMFSFFGTDVTLAVGTIRSNVKVYTGAPGSQVFSKIEWIMEKNSSIDNGNWKAWQYFVNRTTFAAGTRVWLSLQCTDIDAGDRLTSFSMHAYQIRPRVIPHTIEV